MHMMKQMSHTRIEDLITFLRLFPGADLICDADSGVMKVELNDTPTQYIPAF